MSTKFLFRGANLELHRSGRALQPKLRGPFACESQYAESIYGVSVYGSSAVNAVLRHQLKQKGHPTSGMSTTPCYDRAIFYALTGSNGLQYPCGYVYKLDRTRLQNCGVKEFVVQQYVRTPSVPEDHEVILVTRDSLAIPHEAVIDITEVKVQ